MAGSDSLKWSSFMDKFAPRPLVESEDTPETNTNEVLVGVHKFKEQKTPFVHLRFIP